MENELKRLPFEFLKQHFVGRLRMLNAKDPERLAASLAGHLLSREPQGNLGDVDEDLEIEITADDLKAVSKSIRNFTRDELPKVFTQIRKKEGLAVAQRLKRRWPAQRQWQQARHAEFRERLEGRWGKGFDLLRILLTCAQEIGNEATVDFAKSKAKRNRHKSFVLLHLHARACQITTEIVVLMENGLADGAMARWRTLYELEVVAMLIAAHDDEMAERYLRHEVVETRKQLWANQRHGGSTATKHELKRRGGGISGRAPTVWGAILQ